MCKELKDMTLEELWELFPIILKEHNYEYKNWYEIEKEKIVNASYCKKVSRINHIGSSVVPGLLSKPTIDILLEIKTETDINHVINELTNDGWGLMSSQVAPYLNYSFNKGYTKYGFAEKVYHLHVRLRGDWKELYFRDYLIEFPEIAEEYSRLKLKIFKDFEHDRDGYTNAKTDFISYHTDKARIKYYNRYKDSDHNKKSINFVDKTKER